MSKNRSVINSNLLLVFGITLMSVMGVASITPAFPEIIKQLGLSKQKVGLLITFFTLPGIFLTPFLGIAADWYGRKKILIFSLLLFGITGGLCGFIRDFNTLLVLRFFQGIGAAALGSLNTTIIGDLYQGAQRAEAMGINAGVLSIGTASYPLLGGAVAAFGWNYPFLLPWLALPLAFMVLKFLHSPEPGSLPDIGEYLKGAWKYIANKRTVSIFSVVILVFVILYGVIMTYFSVLLGQIYGASSFFIGSIMFIMSISTALVSMQLGSLSKHFASEKLLRFGFLCYASSLLFIALNSRLWLFTIPMIVFGIGHGLNIPTLHTLLADQAPLKYRAAFMSLNGAMLRVGQSLGPLIFGIIYTFWDYKGVFYLGALLGVLAIIIVYGIHAHTNNK